MSDAWMSACAEYGLRRRCAWQAELEAVNRHGHAFHPEGNDTREPASTYLAPPNS
jgi:hypothetical protein